MNPLAALLETAMPQKRKRPRGPMHRRMEDELYGLFRQMDGGPVVPYPDAIPPEQGGYGLSSYGLGQYGET